MKTLKIFKAISAVAVVLTLSMYFSGCGSNNDSKPDSLAGTYKFKSATATSVNGTAIPGGLDITDAVKQGLFSAVSCDDANNAGVKLEDGGKLYFSCIGESSADVSGGTWTENNDRTELTLNLASPPLTNAVAVKITNVETSGNTITGKIASLPIPSESIPGQPAGGTILVDLTIGFDKVVM